MANTSTEAPRLAVGGHRGMGCTDHDFYQTRRDITALPVENTQESIKAAYAAGADYVEIDAVMSSDGVLFTLHNVVPADHFFGAARPAAMLNQLSFDEIMRHGTGRGGQGKITPLAEILDEISKASLGTLPWDVNIEIKGVQGSDQAIEKNDYIKNLADVVKNSLLPVERVLFSSFALHNVMAMSHELPKAQYGMLFGEKPDPRPIYADRRDNPSCQYLPYNPAHTAIVKGLWGEGASTKSELGYFHPEFASLTPDTIMLADRHDAGINSWALFEEMTSQRRADYTRLADACQAEDVPFSVITDYISAFR